MSHLAFAAEDVVTPSNTQQKANAQLPEWFYRELISIKKDVSDFDATGATKDDIQELRERISKTVVRLEESQLRIDERFLDQNERITDIADSNSFSIALFSAIAGVLGTLIAVFSIYSSWKANREAVASAKQEAQNALDGWTDDKGAEITKAFDVKLKELNQRHEKELEVIREQAEVQAADSDITEAYILANQKRNDEAVRRIHYVIQRFWKSDLLRHQKIVAKAMFYRGIVLNTSHKPKAAINAYDELLKRFKDNDELAIQEFLAMALLNKGVQLSNFDNLKAIQVFEELDERYKGKTELVLEVQVANALNNKANILGNIGSLKTAIEVCEELDQRFKGREEPELIGQRINVCVNKAEWVLITQDKSAAKAAIEYALSIMPDDEGSERRAALEMLRVIIGESSVSEVFCYIKNIHQAERLKWGFSELKPIIAELSSPTKEQVEAIVRFFEKHKDKAKLKEELDALK